MVRKARSRITYTDYVCAPWFLRLRWWFEARFWSWCKSFERTGAEAPDQVNPLWRR